MSAAVARVLATSLYIQRVSLCAHYLHIDYHCCRSSRNQTGIISEKTEGVLVTFITAAGLHNNNPRSHTDLVKQVGIYILLSMYVCRLLLL